MQNQIVIGANTYPISKLKIGDPSDVSSGLNLCSDTGIELTIKNIPHLDQEFVLQNSLLIKLVRAELSLRCRCLEVKRIQQTPRSTYKLKLSNLLSPLKFSQQSRSWYNCELTDVLTSILNATSDLRVEYKISKPVVTNFFVQVDETDWEYLHYLLAEYNLFYKLYYFEKYTTLLISDDLTKLNSAKPYNLTFVMNTGMPTNAAAIYNIQCRKDSYIEKLPLKLQADEYYFIATTYALDLMPGQIIKIQNHPLNKYNGQFIILSTNIQQRCCQIIYIALTTKPERVKQQRKIYNFLSGQIIAQPNSQTNLDETGAYQVEYDFAIENRTKFMGSPPVKLLREFYSECKNTIQSMHFPLPIGQRVVLACIDGLPENPIILGALPNRGRSIEPSLAVWQTKNKQQVKVINKDDKLIELGVAENSTLEFKEHELELNSHQGDLQISSDKDLYFETTSELLQQAQNHTLNVKQNYQVATQEGNIQIQADQDNNFSINNNLNCENANLQIDATSADINIANKMQWLADEIDIKSQNNLNLSFAKNINLVSQQGEIILQQGDAKISLNPNGEINLSAETISIKGDLLGLNDLTGFN